jgi:hypothetical protein
MLAALVIAFILGALTWSAGGLPATSAVAREESGTSRFLAADRIEARELILRDGQGRSRASFFVDGGDVVRFQAGSAERNDALVISVFPDGRSALLLRDKSGRNRVTLHLHEDGRPTVALDHDATLILRDAAGRNRAVLSAHEESVPTIFLDDQVIRSTSRAGEPAGPDRPPQARGLPR